MLLEYLASTWKDTLLDDIMPLAVWIKGGDILVLLTLIRLK